MAKIDVINNNSMAMFMLCEAIDEETEEFRDIHPDENGLYDISIKLNGKEINVERFINSLNSSYKNAVKERAASLLNSEYEEILHTIYEIQESLENHNKLFDDKTCGL